MVRFCVGFVLALFALQALSASDTEINLLMFDKIEPAYMHGKVTGVRRWLMNDFAREQYIQKHHKYISGEDCFRIDVNSDGEATLSFPDPLPAPYVEKTGETINFYIGFDILPPAQGYRSTGRVRFDKGNIRLSNGVNFKPNADWQSFDHIGERGFFIKVAPAAGASFGFADIRLTAVYPKVGGSISLRGGGKLTRLLIPENADCVTRWSLAMWRGWLWKMTGVALPIETVSTVEPTTGAFAAVQDRSLKRGWRLQVNGDGITLRYSEHDDIVPALMDYLRMGLGCAFYAPDCIKMPKLPLAELPDFDRTVNPHFKGILHSMPHVVMSGGKLRATRYVSTDVNFYHLPSPNWSHTLNLMMPQELYFNEHPEYFMMNADGKRVASHHPATTQPCFSNPGARQALLSGIKDYLNAMEKGLLLFCISPGDSNRFCQCPNCTAFKKTGGNFTDMLMDFYNSTSSAIREASPDLRLSYGAYLGRCLPPKKVKPAQNISVHLCLTEHVLPCTLHPDCERNRDGIKMAEGWKRVLDDDTSRMGFETYDDARPLSLVRLADYYNRFGSEDLYMYQWHYTPVAVQFVLPRWNLGEDVDKLMEEFDLYYYGNAGKAMHKITLFIDEYGRNIRHDGSEGKLTVLFCGHQSHTKSVFDRATLDKLYALFDEAIAAAGDDKVVRSRIFEEKKFVLAEDFIKFGPATCATDAELDAFIKRIVDFIKMAREAPNKFGRITTDQDMRTFLLSNTGLAIPDTGRFWANEPIIDKLLAEPKPFFSKADRMPGGWYFKPLAMRGAESPALSRYKCPPRYAVTLRRPSQRSENADAKTESDKSKVTIMMTLDYTPSTSSFLIIEGQDDEKVGTSLMRVSMNGKEIFSGLNRFPELSWGRMGLTVPAGVLKKGENTIVIANITPNHPSRSLRFTNPEEAAKDPQWGWIDISEAYWLDPNGDFERFVKGVSSSSWCYNDGSSRGTIDIRDGGARLPGGKMGPTYFYGHQYPKLAVAPGDKVRLTAKAYGSGSLRLCIWNYRAYKGKLGDQFAVSGYAGDHTYPLAPNSESEWFRLSDTPQTFTCVLTPQQGTGLIIPRVYADKESMATVTEFRIEILPPDGTTEVK